MNRKRVAPDVLSLLALLGLLLSACVPDLANPPRLQAPTQRPPEDTSAPMNLRAPTPTGEPMTTAASEAEASANPTVTLWVNRTSPQYEAALETMLAEYTASHEVHVELVTIAPDLLPELVQTAAVSRTYSLPDVVMLPLEYAAGWDDRGILDPEAAHAVVQELGPETFDQEALALVSENGRAAAIPSDGWQQLLLYRQDWFDERELPAPDSYERMLSASEVISDRVNLVYSFNMPTESSLTATSRAFEHLAIANGCQLVDEKGELLILESQCEDALAFYRFLCNTYCPPGVQTEVSALNAYLEGHSGMILTTPGALPALAGLDEANRPTCAACETADYLAQNTGVVTGISGRSPQAALQNFGEITYLGITTVADEEAAASFARFWFNEGYLRWLGVEPERKVPMRLGTPDEPTRFIEAWYDLPLAADGRTLSDIFGRDVADTLAENVVNSDRWGYKQGQGNLITTIYEELTISILVQELLSGYYDSERAAIEGYKRLVELIPDYEYYVDPEPAE